ncbi:MAG TPA: M56 family metallopeptidase [Terriglobales bacterium]|nr:M56 family metallopeptidase [Terriglobales bacterium]
MNFSNWLTPEVMRPAGWALLHFLWQGTALAALATVAMAPFRKASARYVVAVGILLLMLAAPVATFFYYRAAEAVTPWVDSAPAAELHRVADWPGGDWKAPERAAVVMSRSAAPDLFPMMVQLWLVGVAIFSLRSAGGFFLLERMRRRQSVPVSGELREICLALQHHLGLTRAIRYAQCRWLDAPAVIGWFRPIVFLPFTALTGLSEAQLQVVIAHELAHIKRLDSFVNAFQVVVETLLFYHPAVWWLNKRIRLERENCCDDAAIALCGNAVEYARALTLMEEWRVAPGLAMAVNRGPLSARITRLLGMGNLRSGIRGIGLTSSALCLTVAMLAGNAIFGIAHKASAQATPSSPSTPASPARPATPHPPASKSSLPTKASPAIAPQNPPQAPVQPVVAGSYIEGLKAVGLGQVDVDELIAMKVQGVTPEYVRGIQEQGVHPGVDELIAMKVQGVTPEYIREVRAAGLTVSEEEIIGMKVQGINADYIRGLQELGLKLDADDAIGMKVQGVTPDYVRAMKAEGIETSGDEIIGMKVQGVTPEYVRQIRALGLKPSVDEIVAMRVQGVTPDYIKTLQAAGFKFDIDELVGAKVQGITPEFIENARAHGFNNLTLDKLIQLRQLGILDKKGEI